MLCLVTGFTCDPKFIEFLIASVWPVAIACIGIAMADSIYKALS